MALSRALSSTPWHVSAGITVSIEGSEWEASNSCLEFLSQHTRPWVRRSKHAGSAEHTNRTNSWMKDQLSSQDSRAPPHEASHIS